MTIERQIKEYIVSQPEPKQSELNQLHHIIQDLKPTATLWFLDGLDSNNKVVSNPNIGYGTQTMKYAGGKTKEFYRVGLSANTTGISVYIMGLEDKKYLITKYGDKLGKASVTGYCIKFKSLKDIQLDVLKDAIQDAFDQDNR